jgi:hypothetical protein
MNGEVRIIEKGQSGYIEYVENGNICQCDWELSGGETIAIIWVPAAEGWDNKYPWAKGRRQEVLNILVNETRRQRAPLAAIEWQDNINCIYFKQPS